MIYTDILVNSDIAELTMKNILAQVFHTSEEKVKIIYDIEEFPELGHYKVICQKQFIKGSFFLLLGLYLYENLEEHPPEELKIIEKFAKLAKADCLMDSQIDDGEVSNPYAFLLVKKDGTKKEIFVDPEKLDDLDEYHVVEE